MVSEVFESESVMPRIRVGVGYDPTQGRPGIEGCRRLAPAAGAVAIARVVAGPEAGAVIVLVRVARSVRAIEPLVCLAIIAMTNGIVAAALLTIVLRVLEPVGITARECGLLIAARETRRRTAQAPDSAATPLLRVSGKRAREKS